MNIFDKSERTYTKKEIKQVLSCWAEAIDSKLEETFKKNPDLKLYQETQYKLLAILFGVAE